LQEIFTTCKPNELRYLVIIEGKDIEDTGPGTIRLVEATRVYDFDPEDYEPTEAVTPLSRAFILSHVFDIRCPCCGIEGEKYFRCYMPIGGRGLYGPACDANFSVQDAEYWAQKKVRTEVRDPDKVDRDIETSESRRFSDLLMSDCCNITTN
jgi:hypothetical protein